MITSRPVAVACALVCVAVLSWAGGFIRGTYEVVQGARMVATTVAASQAAADAQCAELKKKVDSARTTQEKQQAQAAFDAFSAKVSGSDTGGQGAECRCGVDINNNNKGVCRAGQYDQAPPGDQMPMMPMMMPGGGMPMMPMLPMPMMGGGGGSMPPATGPCEVRAIYGDAVPNEAALGEVQSGANDPSCPPLVDDTDTQSTIDICEASPRSEGCPRAHECLVDDTLFGCTPNDEEDDEESDEYVSAESVGDENPADAGLLQNPLGLIPRNEVREGTIEKEAPYATVGNPGSTTESIQSFFRGLGVPIPSIRIQATTTSVSESTVSSVGTPAPQVLVEAVNNAARQVFTLVERVRGLFGF